MPRKSNPNRGGYREGAKRPPLDPSDVKNDPPITLRLGTALRARFNAARGDRSNAECIREALEAWLKDRPTSS